MKRQQEIAGTERPEQNEDIENALYAWFDAKEQQKLTAEATKMKHASLLLQVESAGLEFYPYLDPKTGKKMRIRVVKTPKVATERDVYRKRDKDADVGDEVTAPDAPPIDNVVEMRRVKRSSVISEIDPFAATRGALDEAKAGPHDHVDTSATPFNSPKKSKKGK